MNKYILGIDGMGCGMCEMHVEEAIRKAIIIKKVKASHFKNNAVVFTELNLGEEDFIKALEDSGYRVTSFTREAAVRRLFGWR